MPDNDSPKYTTSADEKLPELDAYKIRKATITIRALNNTIRKQIIAAIKETGSTTVTELYIKLRLEQSILSQHLAILRKIGVLKQERNGKFVHYSINHIRLDKINELVTALFRS